MKSKDVQSFAQTGALMIELLVTLVVVAIGMWAMLDLHTRLQVSEQEAYQRTQALLLLGDLVERMRSNRQAAGDYLTNPIRGLGVDACSDPLAAPALAGRDRAQWCQGLQGSAEVYAGHAAGALIAGRGCVEALDEVAGEEYLLTVVWQGAVPLSAPPGEIRCGKGQYDQPAGSACALKPDSCRRYVSTRIHIAELGDS
ncbi:hypothetical protein [Pseudohalioglobus lutimaris]|uniref:hypothetical protein n=1 Tax=Pseudohalioglobus lutimaris TaxID=1737061 RepID=UPI001A9FC465|nr:hypothetical protein [Pseudohalioglobus lutimaris]